MLIILATVFIVYPFHF